MSRNRKRQSRERDPVSAAGRPASFMTVCGIHAANAAIYSKPGHIVTILIDNRRHDQRIQELAEAARQRGLTPEFVDREVLDNHAQGQVHQGIVLLTQNTASLGENDLKQLIDSPDLNDLILVLDGIQDPHNLGACLRTAEAAGASLVIAPKDRAVALTPTVRKAASGAAERLPFIQVTNLARTLKQLQQAGYWLTGTTMDGRSLYEADFNGPVVIVMGSEGKGMRRLTREQCDQLVSIPMQGEIESLNVSVATGIVLYEVNRQRTYKTR